MTVDNDGRALPANSEEIGGRVTGTQEPAFHLVRPVAPVLPVLIASPHCGRHYPAQVLEALRDPGQTCLRLEDRHVDAVAVPVAAETGVSLLLSNAPRAMIDLNRSAEDIDWGMVHGEKPRQTRHSLANRRSRNGLGLVPRRIPGLGEIWRRKLERAELDAWIDDIYTPYHTALSAELERLRDEWGTALLIDLHSMPPLRRKDPQDLPAEFVIGDRFGASCDPALADLALRYFAAHGRRVAHNRPYSGGYVLDRYGQRRRGIHAVQVEVCRSTYLDARLDQPSARVPAIARLIAGLVRALGEEVVARHGTPTFSQAAE